MFLNGPTHPVFRVSEACVAVLSVKMCMSLPCEGHNNAAAYVVSNSSTLISKSLSGEKVPVCVFLRA